MKNRLILLAGVFILLTAFTTGEAANKNAKKANYPFQIGYFSVGGQTYDAYGDGGGHVDAVFTTDSNFNDVALVYSWSGTYTSHQINVSFKLTSGGTPLSFAGLCWY